MAATVLVIDGGGRASALVDKYSQSTNVDKILSIPGNDFMCTNIRKPIKIFPHIKTTDIKKITDIAIKYRADLVDVAQDDAVEAGLVDTLIKENIPVFGPTKEAGRIEWDKAYSRKFMKKFDIPTPKYEIFNSINEGINFIKKSKNNKWYVKASGLAAGKGALHAENNRDAIEKIKQMANFKEAGRTYLVEECLEGEEFSAFAAACGQKFQIIGYAQDHKKVFEEDKGKNTGGMGCSSPPKVVTQKIERQVKNIFEKTLKALTILKTPYTGIIYLGGMVDNKGKVCIIEFNSRWGDPEAQVLLPSIKNDYFNFVNSTLKKKIQKIQTDKKYRIVVSVASKGYPDDYSRVTGKVIEGFEKLRQVAKVYGAGIKKQKNNWIASGGRLFYVVGEGKNVAEARKKAYNHLSLVDIKGKLLHYRKDIGYRDLKRLNARSTN